MSAYSPSSDFLKTLTERGFIHQCSDLAGLDAKARSGELVAYIGFDCTAPSLHVGSLLPIMLLRWLQKTGGKPIVLVGGGTTRVGDPSGKDESRKLLSLDDIDANKTRLQQVFAHFLAFGEGGADARDGRQRRVADRAELHRLPARCRPAFLGQPHADDGFA